LQTHRPPPIGAPPTAVPPPIGSAEPTTVFSLYGISLSLSLSTVGHCWLLLCFFSLSMAGHSLGFVLLNFCCFCCLFLVLEDAGRVFDKMSEPNCAWFGCDNLLLSFFFFFCS